MIGVLTMTVCKVAYSTTRDEIAVVWRFTRSKESRSKGTSLPRIQCDGSDGPHFGHVVGFAKISSRLLALARKVS